IYALPGQTPAQWQADLARALSFGTSHLSLYQLTIEPGTRFETMVRRGDFIPLDDDAGADLFDLTQDMTRAAGLPAYEISNHARPGEESRHNLAYWRYDDYVGIGPGAHGRRTGHAGKCATQRHKKPENWLAAVEERGSGNQIELPISRPTQASEALLMGLRLAEGIDLSALSARVAIPPEHLVDPVEEAGLAALGLLRRDGQRLIITPKGMPLLDAILPRIVPDELVSA
ncbi:MAG TPA: coproporphyrinogen III oxidase, partial [Paracoccaceae bacterium]|nr:coproporphyrinogen III oxidase [Paracoccaceae bacterium]